MARRSSRRKWLFGPLVSLAVLVVLDQVVGRAVLVSGVLGERPLPPFAEELDAEQERWLASIAVPLDQRSNTIFTVDPELGWTNASNGVAQGGDDTTNSRGFRGRREYAVPRPDGVVRVACYGDSFTWGADVPDDAAYPAALERLAPGLEAPNLGVSAYGTDQALLRFRRDGADLDPTHVVVGIMVENIGRNVNRYRPLWAPYSTITCVKPRFVLVDGALEVVPSPYADTAELVAAVRDGSVLADAAPHEHWAKRPRLRPLAISPAARLVGSLVANHERDVARLWTSPDEEPYRVTRAILSSFHDEALARGAEGFLVVLFPDRAGMHAVYSGGERYWQGLLDELRTAGIEVLDVTDVLRDEHARRRESRDRAPMYTLRNHLRPPYNEAVARAVLEHLDLAAPSGG